MSLAEEKKYYLEEHAPKNPQEEIKTGLKAVENKKESNKLQVVSRLEKVVGVSFVVALVFLSVATIKLTTAVNHEEEAITGIQQKMSQAQKDVNKLEQEKNELLRQDRVKEIADKAGIKPHEDSIRTIRE
ncbi:cell division protein FtsL [Vagococcus silagei]|uniref:Cell division protein FtsL n=1 Tax=Vagococcus silagei TaxID=2508885 RepID=A0A4S3B5E3_9ENTE|nr:cell division protein FtsL [Vagococcus silagei]THB60853.1 cell division protein FtsL [Vagococcus silagei]